MLNVTKTCDLCDKNKVCKYKENRRKVEEKLNDCIPYAIEGAPFSVSTSCSEFTNSIKTRGVMA